MAKHPNNRPKPVKREDPMTGAMKFFLAGCVAELYLLIVRRFYVQGTLSQVVAWDEYLKYFAFAGVAALIVGAVLSFLWKAQPKKRVIGWSVAGAGLFLAAASFIIRTNMSLLSLMIVAVPAVMMLGIVWCLYDRECALSLTVLGISLLVVWAGRRGIYYGGVKLLIVLYLAFLAAALLLVCKAVRNKGMVGSFRLLPAKTISRSVYVSFALSLLCVLTVLISVTVAYYAMWLLAALLFALAVYYTVKQL